MHRGSDGRQKGEDNRESLGGLVVIIPETEQADGDDKKIWLVDGDNQCE